MLFLMGILTVVSSQAQDVFTASSQVPYTPVKNQGNTGTCWSFSTTSLVESQTIKAGLGEFDLSEIYIVRQVYKEKARNYILRQGAAQFGPGGLGHDVIRAIARYGAVPESVYSGLSLGQSKHDHQQLDNRLKHYLDSLLKQRPLPGNWLAGFDHILDDHLGKVPEKFMYRERQYTPQTFAAEVLKFNPQDYVALTSYTHHPFYSAFILEAPDNFLNGSYYNLPLEELLRVTEKAVSSGYSLMWDADVSNRNFRQQQGYALWPEVEVPKDKTFDVDTREVAVTQPMRQASYENLTTQDDHLMHLVGVEKTKGGKTFFLVKNSWGEVGPFKGMIHVSEAYFALNTVSVVVPRAALDEALRSKLRLP